MKKEKGAGRPSTITSEVIEKVKGYIMSGISLKDACLLADTNYSTWSDHERADPDLRRKRKAWQSMLVAQAKINISKQVFNNHDVSASIWIIEHAEKAETKRAINALNRARAKRERAQAQIAERQAQQLKQLDDSSDQAIIVDDFTDDEEVSDYDDSNKDED